MRLAERTCSLNSGGIETQIRRIGKEDLDRLVKFHRAIVDNLRSGDLKALKNIRIESYLVGKAYN